MELISLYPFDPTARATSNKIENESITVIPPSHITDYSYIVPRAAPFYAETLVVKDGKTAGARRLVENVDYWCVIDFLSASASLNKRVSVGIALIDPNYSGTLYVSYQTLGGNYTMADYSVLEELIRERYIVKHVSYEQIINLPAGFSPEWHKHEVADMVGMSSVVTSLNNIKVATESRNGSYGQIEQQLRNHVNSTAAHTPADIGLGNVKNYGVATLTDAKGGSVSKYITADILKQYVAFEKNDVSGFLSKSDAALTYQTIANMSKYYDKVTSDGRYAYKTDTYTKGQVDAMLSGIDVSSALGDYYTKSQSDGRYASKGDLGSYSTTAVSDGKYASKVSLNDYYTKVDSDGRFALKAQSYTKGESDGRYLGSTALNGYLTQSVADGRYQSKTDMSTYLPVNSQAYGRVNTVGFSNITNGKRLTITDINPAGPKTWTADLDLSDYAKTTGNVTRDDVVKMYVYLLQQRLQLHQLRATTVVTGYFNNKLTTQWIFVACRMTRSIKIHAYIVTPFYYEEDVNFPLTFSVGKALPNVGSNLVNLEYMSFSADLRGYHQQQDTWVRPATAHATLDKAAGTLSIPMRFSWAASNKSSYSSGLLTTVELIAPTDTDFHSMISLMQAGGTVTVSDLTTPPFGADLRAHMGW